MCGICGIVGSDDRNLVAAMTKVLAHRGPDGEGVETFAPSGSHPPAALGHRRLSIIDPTERGAQPMPYASERFWITYNGELYNYRELRRELEADGFEFESGTDTEVLLAMYARDGERMIDRLNGMFAFAIWDADAGELFLARDRTGIKPLYFSHAGDQFVFASEIKAMLPAIGRPSLRSELVAQYLTFLWVPDPDTLFDGIQKLPPGHCARYSAGRLTTRQYWDPTFAVDEDVPSAAWATEVRTTLGEAVERQMVSDVPIGAFLSGGLDSGLIVSKMRQHVDPLSVYTVGFAEEDLAHEIVPDDVGYARQLAKGFGLDHHERTLRPDIVDLLPKLVWHMDDPIADPAAISTYLICSAARESMTVILSGMGGDEVFAGYPRHLAAQLTRPLGAIPASVRRRVREALEGRLTMGAPGRLRGPRRNLMKLMRGIDRDAIERYLVYCAYYRDDELSGLLSPELNAATGRAGDPFSRHRAYAAGAGTDDWLNQILYLDMKTFLPCLNLAYTDKMSMAASTEVRVPFLDNEVLDLGGRIPPNLKLHRTTRKYVLKKSAEGLLPKEVIWRPKAGFGAPVRPWLSNELRPMVDDLLSPDQIRKRGLLDPAGVRRLIDDNDSGVADNALRIWALIVLELWQQTYLDASPAASGLAAARG